MKLQRYFTKFATNELNEGHKKTKPGRNGG